MNQSPKDRVLDPLTMTSAFPDGSGRKTLEEMSGVFVPTVEESLRSLVEVILSTHPEIL